MSTYNTAPQLNVWHSIGLRLNPDLLYSISQIIEECNCSHRHTMCLACDNRGNMNIATFKSSIYVLCKMQSGRRYSPAKYVVSS